MDPSSLHPVGNSASCSQTLLVAETRYLIGHCPHRDKAVQGVDYVLHTASPFFMSTKEDELVKPAVAGTLNVLKACALDSCKVGLNEIVSH